MNTATTARNASLAVRTVFEAAKVIVSPADLINVAVEQLRLEQCELPSFSTLASHRPGRLPTSRSISRCRTPRCRRPTRIFMGKSCIEWHVGQQIDLVHYHQVGAIERGRVFQWLIFAFRNTKHHDPRTFTEIVAGWANQVTDVLDEQNLERLQRPALQAALHHAGVQVACASGRDLADGKAVAGKAAGIVIRYTEIARVRREKAA
jgi:hypothetical protein